MCTTSRVGAHGMLLAQISSAVSPGLPDLARTGVFAVGMHRNDTLQQVMQALELERPGPVWKPTVDFVPAVAKASLNLEQLVDLKVVSRWVVMPVNRTLRAFGLSGRSPQDTFTVACALTHRRVWEQIVDRELAMAVVFEDDAAYALPMHSGASQPVPSPTEALSAALQAVQRVDPGWEVLNLGRCFDLCSQTQQASGEWGAHVVRATGQRIITSPSSLCTHAYAISLMGARKMLSLSLPHVFPVDMLLSLLSRMKLLRQYSLSPPTFTQAPKAAQAMVSVSDQRHRAAGRLPECEPFEPYVLRTTTEAGNQIVTDSNALAAIGGAWISQFGPAAQDCPAAYQKLADNQITSVARGCMLSEFRCKFVSSASPHRSSHSASRHRDASALLAQMDTLGLRGAVIWSLRVHDKASRHSHSFVHRALHASLGFAFSQSPKPRHLCWARGDAIPDGCSLGKLLGYEKDDGVASTGSILGHSLVFASPKHMAWSRDRALTNLPVDTHSAYIFHELMPPRFAPLMPLGRVVQWIVSGPDGNRPYLDSANYVARSSALVSECGNWPPCIRTGTPDKPATFVSAWASTLTPAEIEAEIGNLSRAMAARAQKSTVHFIGSIWEGNWENFCKFTAGCRRASVPFVRSGVNEVNPALVTCARNEPKDFVDDLRLVLDDDVRYQLMSTSSFSPAFQGSDHLRTDRPELSYFADRAFDSAALGQVVATNNPAVMQLLSAVSPEPLVFSPNVSDLCGLAAERARTVKLQDLRKLQRFVASDHSYVSRLAAILKTFRPLAPGQAAAAAAALAGRPDAPWCQGYDRILDPRRWRAHRLRPLPDRPLHRQRPNRTTMALLTQADEDRCSASKRASFCIWQLRKSRCIQMSHDRMLDSLDQYDRIRCLVICKTRQTFCAPPK